jgi:hypothetical protein
MGDDGHDAAYGDGDRVPSWNPSFCGVGSGAMSCRVDCVQVIICCGIEAKKLN